jgi:hypothetical protein
MFTRFLGTALVGALGAGLAQAQLQFFDITAERGVGTDTVAPGMGGGIPPSTMTTTVRSICSSPRAKA